MWLISQGMLCVQSLLLYVGMVANMEVDKPQLRYPGLNTQYNGKVNCWLIVKCLVNKARKENIKKKEKKPPLQTMVQPAEMKGSL